MCRAGLRHGALDAALEMGLGRPWSWLWVQRLHFWTTKFMITFWEHTAVVSQTYECMSHTWLSEWQPWLSESSVAPCAVRRHTWGARGGMGPDGSLAARTGCFSTVRESRLPPPQSAGKRGPSTQTQSPAGSERWETLESRQPGSQRAREPRSHRAGEPESQLTSLQAWAGQKGIGPPLATASFCLFDTSSTKLFTIVISTRLWLTMVEYFLCK